MTPPLYLSPGVIGEVHIANRLVRASTSETMATAEGTATERLASFYGELAAGGVGLILTGHIYVETRGQASANQLGLYDDSQIPAMRVVTDAVHAAGGVIFAELGHAGSQTALTGVDPIAPSVTANAMYGRQPRAMTSDDINFVIDSFANAARRAVDAGYDGIHIHGGNGYLISEFSSPITNHRTDEWGGSANRRSRFFLAVYDAVRSAVGSQTPITARIGLADSIAGGLTIQESVVLAQELAKRGVDGLEPTYGIMRSYRENIPLYVSVNSSQAVKNVLLQRLVRPKATEAHYRAFARALKASVTVPIILVGGIRTTEMMTAILGSGDADFLAMSRPFIREPDLVNKLSAGRTGMVDCVSCNMCLTHDGTDPLRCWRSSPAAVGAHIYTHHIRGRIRKRG